MKLEHIYEELSSNTMKFWHGGNLEDFNETIAQKNGRYEYGPGLYLITKYDVAKNYSKGRRKLYIITVEKGNDINNSFLTKESVDEFIKNYVISSLRKLVTERLSKYYNDNKIKAFIFNNVILNNKAIKSSKTQILREFYIENNIDYEIVENAFGYGEKMMVLYNMKKIKDIKQNDPSDKFYDDF